MKKNLALLLLAILVFPSVAFASWWNPFSWFGNWSFSKPIQQTQLENKTSELEQKVKELENKLVEKDGKVEVKAVTIPAVVESKNKPSDIKITPEPLRTDLCSNIEGIQENIPTGFSLYANTRTCLTEKEIEKYENIQSQAVQYQNRLKEDDAKYEEQVDKINSIKQQIIDLNIKYLNDKEVASKNMEGSFGGGLNQKLQDLYNKYTSDYNYLSLQYQQALLDLDNY